MEELISQGTAFYQANKDMLFVGAVILWAVIQFIGKRILAGLGAAWSRARAVFTFPPKHLSDQAIDIIANVHLASLRADDGVLCYHQVRYYPDGTVKLEKLRSNGTEFQIATVVVPLEPHETKAVKLAHKDRLEDERQRLKAELVLEAATPKDAKWQNHFLGRASMLNLEAASGAGGGGAGLERMAGTAPNGPQKR